MKHFFSASLIAVAVFVVWTRSTSTKQRQNSPAPATTTQQHTPRCRPVPAPPRHARRTLPATARHLPASWKVKAIQTLAFFHGWLVNWGTTPSNARAHADARRRERQWVPVVSVLWYGSSCRARSPGKKLALQLFFWWMRKPTALDSKPCHVYRKAMTACSLAFRQLPQLLLQLSLAMYSS